MLSYYVSLRSEFRVVIIRCYFRVEAMFGFLCLRLFVRWLVSCLGIVVYNTYCMFVCYESNAHIFLRTESKWVSHAQRVHSGVRPARSFVFYVMLCRSLFVLLYFFFWPLCCLFFSDIRILIAPLVSSNSSCNHIYTRVCIIKNDYYFNLYLQYQYTYI